MATKSEYQQQLTALQANATSACLPAGTAQDRQTARENLRIFRETCPYSDLQNEALVSLNELSLADINHALGNLQAVKQQLLDNQDGLRATTSAATPQPLRQAQRALVAAREEVAKHPTLAEVVQHLDATIEKLDQSQLVIDE